MSLHFQYSQEAFRECVKLCCFLVSRCSWALHLRRFKQGHFFFFYPSLFKTLRCGCKKTPTKLLKSAKSLLIVPHLRRILMCFQMFFSPGCTLLFYETYGKGSPEQELSPRYALLAEDSVVQAVPEHPKKENVFCLSNSYGDVYLFQVGWCISTGSSMYTRFARIMSNRGL